MKIPFASPRLAAALVTLLGSMAFAAKNPAPSAKVVDAYSKYVCFVMLEVASGTPEDRRACEKDVGEALVQVYPSLPAEERKDLDQIPATWAALQKEWASLDEAQRNQVRAEWAQMLQSQMEADTATGGAGQDKP
jgi:hypothetical protein